MKEYQKLTVLICIAVIISWVVVKDLQKGMNDEEPARLTCWHEQRIPTVEEFQRLVGTEEDGIWGPNSNECWKASLVEQAHSEYNWIYEEKHGLEKGM